jgi:hypothetical protein
MITERPASTAMAVPLSKVSDLTMKSLDWNKGRGGSGKTCYEAEVAGLAYMVSQNDDGSWRFFVDSSSLAEVVSDDYCSAEEAITSAEDHFKTFMRCLLAATVETLTVSEIVEFPPEPDEDSIRALFTLNSPVPRSTDEVRQVYASLRNLAALPKVSGYGE